MSESLASGWLRARYSGGRGRREGGRKEGREGEREVEREGGRGVQRGRRNQNMCEILIHCRR